MAIGKFLSLFRRVINGSKFSEAKIDQGGGDLVNSEQFGPAGDDFHPLPGDYTVSVKLHRNGGYAVVGYIDPKNQGETEAGERRIYSRDANGDIAAFIKWSNDGAITAQNNNGSFELQADGTFIVNGVTIDTDGNISTDGEVTASNVELSKHIHTGVQPGSGTSGPPQS